MTVKLSVIAPVLNECPWIGFSILAAFPYVHEFIYTLDEKSDDGTRELLHYIKDKYAHEKLVVLDHPHFHPHDMVAYNYSYNRCIDSMTGDAAFFLHPDMIITEAPLNGIHPDTLAWWTEMTSYAGDFNTVITKGRCTKWKNIHAKRLGLHYYGGYGSQNEDFYHSDITGKSYKHYGTEFSKYPFQVMNSGIKISHFCENKDYQRRYEKMVLCLKTQNPNTPDKELEFIAKHHPRVTLKDGNGFQFETSKEPVPEVLKIYGEEFNQFKKELVHG